MRVFQRQVPIPKSMKFTFARIFIFTLLLVGIYGVQTAMASEVRLDTTFNTVGYVAHDSAAGGSGNDVGRSLQIQSDGKYVVTGYSITAAGDGDLAIWRYNPDGTLDTTFSATGYVTHDSAAGGNRDDASHALQIQTDGKYVIAGNSTNAAGNRDLAIWRYNPDGTLDLTFNAVGYVVHDSAAGGSGEDKGKSLQIQSDGKYVVAGYSTNAAGDWDLAIWRYNPNGTLDATFNATGYVTHDGAAGGKGHDRGRSLQIQSDGKYVVVGYSTNAAVDWDLVIWRYNPDGTLDLTFGGTGYVTHDSAAGGNSDDGGWSLQIQSDGKYVVAGYSTNAAGDRDLTVWRYNPDGTLDLTFNTMGYATHGGAAGGIGRDVGKSLQIQSDGKYVITGHSINATGNADLAIWRYNSDGTLDTTFNTTGHIAHDSAAGGSDKDRGNSLQIQSDGKYVIAGISKNAAGNLDLAVWRYENLYRADLSLSIIVDDAIPSEADTVIYPIRVTNDGPDEATNIIVNDVVPSGLTYVAASMIGGDWQDDTDPAGAGLSWSIASLSAGDFRDLAFQAEVDTLTAGSVVTNYSQITSADQTDPDSTPDNGTPPVVNEDDESAVDITVQGTDDEGTGDVIECVLTIDNNGDGRPDAVDAEISDYDGDGIPDCCQDSASPQELLDYDHDGDGFSDCMEYRIGSDPLDPYDINMQGGGFSCQLASNAAGGLGAAGAMAILLVFMGISRRHVRRHWR